jgi:RHS repeat-associated protein
MSNLPYPQIDFFSSFSKPRIRSCSFGFNGMEKINEQYGEGNAYDFGERIYDGRIARFLSTDKFERKFSSWSPYIFAGNSPIWGIDVKGDSLYILFYTTGNAHGDDLFKSAALTRQHDIENSGHFDPARDKVVVLAVQDMGKIQTLVCNTVEECSKTYGKTSEFSIYSHAAFDGPIGTVTSTDDPIVPGATQMGTKGWSHIDFNWADKAKAGFYGCNTGNTDEYRGYPVSFSTRISALQNFKNVDVWGQTASSVPSNAPDSRTVNSDIINGVYSTSDGVYNFNTFPYSIDKTYMVGSKQTGRIGDFKTFIFGSPAEPMRISRHGVGSKFGYQSGKNEE